MTKKAKSAIALSALVVVGAVGGTFAYWSQVETIDNPFDTGTYGTSLVENFTPEDGEDWEPGATIDKEVYVTNEGDYDLIVRVKLDESWTYEDEEVAYKTILSSDDVYADDNDFDIYDDTYQASTNDGLTTLDGTVVAKTFSDSSNWIAGDDGYYYYAVNLEPGKQTDNWLTDVTLDENIDMGSYEQTYYLSTDDGYTWIEYTYDEDKGVPTCVGANGGIYYESKDTTAYSAVTNNKVVTTVVEDAKGYSESDYVLTITVETVQATEAAVEDMFDITLSSVSYDENWTYYTDID